MINWNQLRTDIQAASLIAHSPIGNSSGARSIDGVLLLASGVTAREISAMTLAIDGASSLEEDLLNEFNTYAPQLQARYGNGFGAWLYIGLYFEGAKRTPGDTLQEQMDNRKTRVLKWLDDQCKALGDMSQFNNPQETK